MLDQVKTHNLSDFVKTFDCPTCLQVIGNHHQFNEEITSCYKNIENLADMFFANNLKLADRKKEMIAHFSQLHELVKKFGQKTW